MCMHQGARWPSSSSICMRGGCQPWHSIPYPIWSTAHHGYGVWCTLRRCGDTEYATPYGTLCMCCVPYHRCGDSITSTLCIGTTWRGVYGHPSSLHMAGHDGYRIPWLRAAMGSDELLSSDGHHQSADCHPAGGSRRAAMAGPPGMIPNNGLHLAIRMAIYTPTGPSGSPIRPHILWIGVFISEYGVCQKGYLRFGTPIWFELG